MDPFKGKGAPGRPAAHDRPGASAGPVLVPSEALRLPGEDLTLHCLTVVRAVSRLFHVGEAAHCGY